MNKINILGINISSSDNADIRRKLEEWLEGDAQRMVVTPNPEIILEALNDEEYFYILNNADLSLPDGVGLKFAGLVMGRNIVRFTGVDLSRYLLKLAQKSGRKVVILNWKEGLSRANEIKDSLQEKYSNLKCLVLDVERDGKDLEPQRINEFAPDILFCCFGSPWQEKYLFSNFKKIPSVKIAVGVGGAFEYHTGRIKSSPKIFSLLGFEWLWRLLKLSAYTDKKKRMRRIFNAVIIFPMAFIKWRFIEPFIFRKNVACLLFRKTGDSYSFFLVERREERGHWQIPQGGLDDLGIIEAGIKELTEEIGNDKFKIISSTHGFVSSYKYDDIHRHDFRGGQLPRHAGYRGQKQALLVAEYKGDDEDIKINYWDHTDWKWVEYEKFLDTIHESRKSAGEIFLKNFNKLIKDQNEIQV